MRLFVAIPILLQGRGADKVDDIMEKMSRMENEKRVVGLMVRLYCRQCEGNKELCSDCAELLKYAEARLGRCQFGEGKPTCKKCLVHCYKPDMRERMRRVMRWAGPRMILYHPLEAIKHLIREKL